MIRPLASFKENLGLLPGIGDITRIELTDAAGAISAVIENQPGKQGSLAVYAYLGQTFDALTAEAAAHGIEVFAEHSEDAKARPGAHPNIDRLFEILNGGAPLQIRVVRA